MNALTITLPDERLLELQEKAARLHVSAEDLVRVSIEELLTQPDEAFREALEYVLKKNGRLYQRLAC